MAIPQGSKTSREVVGAGLLSSGTLTFRRFGGELKWNISRGWKPLDLSKAVTADAQKSPSTSIAGVAKLLLPHRCSTILPQS